MKPLRRRSRRPPGSGLQGFLTGLVACWLFAQALGLAHAVLHPRRAAPPSAVAPAALQPHAARRAEAPAAAVGGDTLASALARAFHPRDDATGADDSVCRLYAQLAQGDVAAGATPSAAAGDGRTNAAPPQAIAGAFAAPRRGTQARAPPARG